MSPIVHRSLLLAVALCAPSTVAAQSKPADELVAQHKALTAALARGDVKAARGFYTADYKAQIGTATHTLDRQMASFQQVLQGGVRLTVRASLQNIAVKGDSATALEIADLTVRTADGKSQKVPTQRTEQRWKRVAGKWRLALEKAVPAPRLAPRRTVQ